MTGQAPQYTKYYLIHAISALLQLGCLRVVTAQHCTLLYLIIFIINVLYDNKYVAYPKLDTDVML